MSATAAIETTIPAGTWTIDPGHSSLGFAIRHLGIATVKGRAAGFAGSIAGGEQASIQGTVPTATLTTFDEARDGHLLSPELFDAERYPELTFFSTSVEQAGNELLVVGDLTLKGITRQAVLRGTVSGPQADPWGNDRIGLDLEGTIDRREYDLRWNAPLPGGGLLLADAVDLAASLSAVRDR